MKLQRLSPRDIEAFEDLRVSVGVQQSKPVNKVISVKSSVLDDAQYQVIKNKPEKERTPEEKTTQ